MKTKTMLGLASIMVFGSALLLGIIVTLIIFFGGQRENEAEASLSNSSENSTARTGFVMLFDGINGQIIRVNLSDGTSQNFSLDFGARQIYMGGRAFSSDGRMMAYCAVERLNDVETVTHFVVRDIDAGQNIIEINFGILPGCNPGAFSPDNRQIAVGFVFNSPITNEFNFPDEPNWALRILDANSGILVQELTADSPNAPDFEAMTEFWFEPGISPMVDVLDYSETSITFLAFPWVGRDGPPASPAFRWDLASNELRTIEGLGNNGGTYLAATGEIAYPYHNPAYAAAQPMGPVALANEIRLSDSSGTRTIYRDTENVIATLHFVNGGRQIAALLIPAYDPENQDEPSPVRYVLVNRDGTVENLNSASQNFVQIFATSNGFGVLKIESQQNEAEQYVNFHQILHYQNGELVIVWEYTPPIVGQFQVWMELLWASPQAIAPNLAPFVTIN